MMANVNSYQRSRYSRLGREAILPFVVGLGLVIAGTVAGLVAAAMAGSFGAPPAAPAPAASTASIEAAAETTRVCRAPAALVDGLPGDGEQEPASTFGFLVFDWDAKQGGSMPGFAPLPATACTSLKSVDG